MKELTMKKAKRITVATLWGVLFGFVCFGIASSSGKLAWPVVFQLITSRTLIGFAIGISCISVVHWSINGVMMGMIFSFPLAFSGLMAPETLQFSKASMFIWTIILGMIYGLIIEVITSVVFKAKAED
jgi:hypothetical protein